MLISDTIAISAPFEMIEIAEAIPRVTWYRNLVCQKCFVFSDSCLGVVVWVDSKRHYLKHNFIYEELTFNIDACF